jgi:phage-related protein
MNGFNAQQKKALYSMNANMKNLMAGAGVGAAGVAGAMTLAKASVIAFAVATTAALAAVSINGVKMAMEYESSLQQVNRIMGANAAGFIKWADTQASSYNMSRLEAVKYGAVYGNLMSSITADQAKAAQYTTDLLKASAVVASATGRQMTDVMERIRSGLLGNTEAIEDLGINVNVAMLESTAAFQRFAGGKSWEQLNFQTQQQIRLFAILEQASSKFGVDVYQNTASGLTQFTSLLKDAQLNLGQAFLPIVQVVTPILISFANNLKYITGVFSQFMQALFGTNSQQAKNAKAASQAAAAQTSLGKATKAASAAAKGSVAGFDEINQLQENLAGNAADAADALGGTAPTIPTAEAGDVGSLLPQGMLDFASKVKEAFGPVAQYFKDLGQVFSDFWNDIQPALQPIVNFVRNVFAPIWDFLKTTIANAFEAIKGIISGALQIIKGIFEVFAGLLTGNWQMLWQGIKDIFEGAFNIIYSIANFILNEIKAVFNLFAGVLKAIWETLWTSISKFTKSALDGIEKLFIAIGKSCEGTFIAIGNAAYSAFTNLANVVSTISESIKVTVSLAWQGILDFTTETWGNIKNTVSAAWDSIKEVASTAWEGIKNSIKAVWDWLTGNVNPTFDGIKNAIIDSFSSAKNIVIGIWDGIKSTIKNAINSVIGMVNSLIDKLNDIEIKIPSVTIPGLGTIGGGAISFPNIDNIPYLAKGGIIASPTLAMLGEGGKKEAVVPLENTSFVDTMASAVGTAVLNAMQFAQAGNGGTVQQEIVMKIDSATFARIVLPALRKEITRTGATVLQGA